MGFEAEENSGAASSAVSLKKSLTAAQIKTGNSVPVNFGLTVPVGKFVQFLGASFFYTANNGLLSLSGINIITQGKTNPLASSGYIDSTINDFGQFASVASSDQIATATDLQIQVNADSAAGTGTLDVYLVYILIDK